MILKITLLNIKNKEAKIMGVNIETDSNGFRVFDRKKLKKILMIGDSMTFGFGSKNIF